MNQISPNSNSNKKQLLLIRQATLAFICAACLTASVFSSNPLNDAAEKSATNLVTSATTTYIFLKSINAFLSIAQETEVSGGIVALSGGVLPLKVLEPIDDTVERMATALFAVAVFSVVMSIAFNPLAIFGWVMLLLYFVIEIWLNIYKKSEFVESLRRSGANKFSPYLVRTGLGLSLVLPIAFSMSTYFGDYLTRAAWDKHQKVIEEISFSLKESTIIDQKLDSDVQKPSKLEVNTLDEIQDKSFLSKISDNIGESRKAFFEITDSIVGTAKSAVMKIPDYFKSAGKVISRSDELLSSAITILAVFIFKALVLPVILGLVILGWLRSSGIDRGWRTLYQPLDSEN